MFNTGLNTNINIIKSNNSENNNKNYKDKKNKNIKK